MQTNDVIKVRSKMIALKVAPDLLAEIVAAAGKEVSADSGLSLVTPVVWVVNKETMQLEQAGIDPLAVIKAMDNYESKYQTKLPKLDDAGNVYVPQ